MDVLKASHSGLVGTCSPGGLVAVKVESGGSERFVLEAYDKCDPKAFLLLAYPYKNSLAAALEAAAALPKGGLIFVKDKEDEMKALSGLKRLERFVGAKIALIGGVADWLVAPALGREDFRKYLGAEVIDIDIKKVIEAYEDVRNEDVEEVVRSVKVGASEVAVSDEDLYKAARLYEALRRLLSGFRAAAINCFPLIKELYVTPCLALALFNAANFPFACEGDLNSLFSMIMIFSALGRVGGVFNLDYVDEEKIMLAHCTAPLTLLDRYSLVRHYETGNPVAIRGYVEEGKDSIALRFAKDDYEIVKGVTMKGPRMDACETQIWMRVREPPKMLGNHRVWVDSGEAEVLEALIRSLGFRRAGPRP
ncbi:MAG: hypothetical protein GXO07_04535 [Crenarchaeota archaeon]|nr:hypothetical protein [Thermoproteota archaeon]